MNERVELLPCPFCGNAGQISYSDRGEIFSVRCVNWSGSVAPLGDDTPCMGSGAYGYTEDEAIANWNRRTILPPPAGHWSDPKTFEEAPPAGDGMQLVAVSVSPGENDAVLHLGAVIASGGKYVLTEHDATLVLHLIARYERAASPHNAVPDGITDANVEASISAFKAAGGFKRVVLRGNPGRIFTGNREIAMRAALEASALFGKGKTS